MAGWAEKLKELQRLEKKLKDLRARGADWRKIAKAEKALHGADHAYYSNKKDVL